MTDQDDIKKKIESFVSENQKGLRAAVSLIPAVGGVLDHLLFDQYNEIRTKNIEASIKAISEKIDSLDEEAISKEWFASPEALNLFKILVEGIQVEHEEEKVKELARVFAVSGTQAFSEDPLKASILVHLSQMTDVSIKLLRLLSELKPTPKKCHNGMLERTFSAIWPDDILKALGHGERFWKGSMDVGVEVDILEALNLVKKVESGVSQDFGYHLTTLGTKAAEYLKA